MNGYEYYLERDKDDDVCKNLYMVILPNGEHQPIPWSPYHYMDDTDFKLWVQLGLPQTPPRGDNFTTELLVEYLNSQMVS